MVDALLRARRLLRPNGCLVDVHPTVESAHVEVGLDLCTGDLHAEDARRRHVAADAALAAIVARGVFTKEGTQEFSFQRYADPVEELWEYVAEKWTDAHFDEATLNRTRDALRSHPTAFLRLHEQARVTKLRPVRGVRLQSTVKKSRIDAEAADTAEKNLQEGST